MKKISFTIFICSLMLSLPAYRACAQDIMSAKIDSARKVFEKESAIRNERLFDTTKSLYSSSPFMAVTVRSKGRGKDTREVFVQLTKFRMARYLGLKVRDFKATPVNVSGNDQLFILLDDQTKLALKNIGGASSKSNGMMGSTDLFVDYEIPANIYELLQAKRIVSLGVLSNLGLWTFEIDSEVSEELRSLIIRNR